MRHSSDGRDAMRCCVCLPADQTTPDLPLTKPYLIAFLGKDGPGNNLGKMFLRWARRNRIDYSNAKDAIQDFLLSLWMRFQRGEATQADLFPKRIVCCGKRSALRHHVRSQRSRPLPPDAVTPDGDSSVRRSMLAGIHDAIARLPEDERAVLTACDLEGRTQAQVGISLGVSQATVYRLLERARRRLGRELIAAMLREGFDRTELPVSIIAE